MTDTRHRPSDGQGPEPARRSIRQSKVLWVALLTMVVGLGLWIREAMKPAPPPAPAAAGQPANGISNSLTATPDPKPGSPSTPAAPAAGIPPAPVTFRVGASFAAGFFLAWLLRKFIKATLLIGGALVAGIALLKWSGLIPTGWLDWNSVEQSVDTSLAQAHEHATEAKDWVLAHLPSAGSAVVGMFFGARRS